MSALSRLLSFFPALVIAIFASSAAVAVATRSPLWLALGAAFVYLAPVALFRCISLFRPIVEGRSYLSDRTYSPWWGSHELQRIFIAFPQLESLLQLVPGAFSLWLRLWGSRIGKNVYWTPRVEIADRSLLEIGANVVFGHKVQCFSHAVKPARRGLFLYVKRIRIGDDVFIGGGSRIGPGVTIESGTFLPILSDLYLGRHYNGDAVVGAPDVPGSSGIDEVVQ